jgi:hypothetical protein
MFSDWLRRFKLSRNNPPGSDGAKPVASEKYRGRPFMYAAIVVGILSIVLEIASMGVNNILDRNRKLSIGFTIVGLCILSLLTILWAISDYTLQRRTKYMKSIWANKRNALLQFVFLINLSSVIYSIINLSIDTSGAMGASIECDQRTIIVLDAVSVLTEISFSILFGLYAWWPIYRAAQSAIMIPAVLQFITSAMIILANSYIVNMLSEVSEGLVFVSALKIQSRPKSSLAVEVFDLMKLTSAQCEAYAQVIDRYGKTVPGAPSGRNAISLMKAYSSANELGGMSCMVLRVYRPDQKANLDETRASYEFVRAWEYLDKEQVIPLDHQMQNHLASCFPLTEQNVSNNKLKRPQKKQAADDAMRILLQQNNAKEDARDGEAEAEFEKQIMSTEALIMITSINNYDLTSNVGGKFGAFLTRTLGAKSKFRPLCIRLGLLAFHWPFRESTFYCSPSKRPVARSAAILRSLIKWNEALPRSHRFTVFLDPRYQHEDLERAIQPSGWIPTPLPPSHIVDLRSHKGKSLPDYLKAIKYRNRSARFNKAGGEVIESTDFSDHECEYLVKLWGKIANKKTSQGHTAVLAKPNHGLIKNMGRSDVNQNGDRSLLFLKVDGKIIASCLLFRLGDTITSDLTGLDHDVARHYKAYFVMMQHTIDIALREGLSFVDFGPTTANAKLDIGCQSVPLIGGMHASSPLLSLAISLSAKRVTVEDSS